MYGRNIYIDDEYTRNDDLMNEVDFDDEHAEIYEDGEQLALAGRSHTCNLKLKLKLGY